MNDKSSPANQAGTFDPGWAGHCRRTSVSSLRVYCSVDPGFPTGDYSARLYGIHVAGFLCLGRTAAEARRVARKQLAVLLGKARRSAHHCR